MIAAIQITLDWDFNTFLLLVVMTFVGGLSNQIGQFVYEEWRRGR